MTESTESHRGSLRRALRLAATVAVALGLALCLGACNPPSPGQQVNNDYQQVNTGLNP
ncbi:MAG TPA: hypothetical protein VFO60_09045 [Candidatus Dormibacteraeota bacterium]|nr:hypothetical protein [Candidatus Dormibacteraeota bacterium]